MRKVHRFVKHFAHPRWRQFVKISGQVERRALVSTRDASAHSGAIVQSFGARAKRHVGEVRTRPLPCLSLTRFHLLGYSDITQQTRVCDQGTIFSTRDKSAQNDLMAENVRASGKPRKTRTIQHVAEMMIRPLSGDQTRPSMDLSRARERKVAFNARRHCGTKRLAGICRIFVFYSILNTGRAPRRAHGQNMSSRKKR